MIVSFDTNILIYATLSVPLAKTHTARDLLVRGMRSGSCIFAWRAALPVQGTEDDDLSAALDAVKKHRLTFWGCNVMGRGTTGVRHLISEDLQDGFPFGFAQITDRATPSRLCAEVHRTTAISGRRSDVGVREIVAFEQ
jgi:predicted nucleic acid-binding protein